MIDGVVGAALENFIFSLNDEDSRNVISESLDRHFIIIKALGHIRDYKIVCDRTNNIDVDIGSHIINANVMVKPRNEDKYYDYTIKITPTSISFN